MNIFDFSQKKHRGEKISMITCYDYTSAKIADASTVDCLLVGDSAAMTMHGFSSTLPATMTMMQLHTAAVSRGAPNKFIISDLPFLSFRQSLSKTVSVAGSLMQAGAHAVKLEGARGNLETIQHLVDTGIPVMGHLGLTPQSVNQLGGYKVQGRSDDSALRIQEEALALQAAGCFAIVLECVPSTLAKTMTQSLSIPTIGIGAGPHTDGQVLVFQDLLGLNADIHFKFVKAFLDGHTQLKEGIDRYVHAVNHGEFPTNEHSF